MFNLLKPQNIRSPKIRLGPSIDRDYEHGDGGYVTPIVMIEKSVGLFTYGVNNDYRYEAEYAAKFNKPAYLFDHTVEHPREPAPGLIFTKEGLGRNIPSCKDFLEHYKEFNINGDVLLKIDVEGCEYDYFEQADIPGMSLCTTGLMLEVHWLQHEYNQQRFINILNRLREFYVITHIHGNNDVGSFDYTQNVGPVKRITATLPLVLELTFTNKRFIDYMVPDDQKYPIKGLDLRNWAVPGSVDCNLDCIND